MTMTETTSPTIFRIPTENLGEFQAKFNKLTKAARKIGVPEPTFTVHGKETFEDRSGMLGELGFSIERTVVLISVEGEAPRFDGWQATAVIDLRDDPHLVHTIGSATANPAWHTVDSTCEHCHTRRNRSKLVAVEHESGERKLVGSTCLHDFLGHASPQGIASWCEVLADMESEFFGFEGGFEGGSRGERVHDPLSALTIAAWLIETLGWVPRSQGHVMGRVPTADLVLGLLNDDPWVIRDLEKEGIDLSKAQPRHEIHKARAEAALAWAKTLQLGSNDYLNNVVVVAGQDSWTHRHIGIGCSILSAHQRQLDRDAEDARKAAVEAKQLEESRWVGEIGKRQMFGPLTVESLRYFDGDYGLRTMAKFLDAEGNVIVWWASGNPGLAEEQVVQGKATVKKHDSYKGVSQTIVNRFAWEEVS